MQHLVKVKFERMMRRKLRKKDMLKHLEYSYPEFFKTYKITCLKKAGHYGFLTA